MQRRGTWPTTLLALLTILTALAASLGPRAAPALAAATVATCAPDSGSSSISGTVTAPGSVPLNYVLVTAYTVYGQRGGYDYTDASGNYQITGLIPGAYILKFEPSSGSYTAEWYNDQPGPLTAATVTVGSGTVGGINAQLDVGARFSGQVTGEGGGPLSSVYVNVYDSNGSWVASAYTDASGNYTTSPGLAPGSYRISFQGTGAYLDEYYNHKPSLATADALTVSAAELRTGINATLARGGKITGHVTNAGTGASLSGIYLRASGNDDSKYAYTDASGNYTIDGLASGSYEVIAAADSDTTNLVGQPQTVNVTAPNTTASVNFALTPGGTITGRVTAEGGAPLKDITVFVGNNDGSYQNYVYTNASGVYTATALPTGTFKVYFRPSNYIPEAYNNHPDFAQADPIAVTAPNIVSGIDAVLAKGAAISGKVTDAGTGTPIKNVFVEVLGANDDRVESTFTKDDGTYQTNTTLATGSYRVRFNADERFASCAYVTAYYNGKPDSAHADLVNVTAPNMTANINATLSRGSIIFGKITDAATGAPITQGSVLVYDAAGKIVMFGRLTFTGGYHTETALPSGSYRIKFTDYDGGYVDEFYNDKPSLAAATPVTLTAPDDLLGINAALVKGGLIAGRVTAAGTGQPFTDGYITVYDTSGAEIASGQIGEDGSYTVLDGLPTGSYRVAAVPYNFTGEDVSLMIAQVQMALTTSDKRNYITTFYGGTVTPGAAKAVQVSGTATTSGIDIAVLQGVFMPVAQR